MEWLSTQSREDARRFAPSGLRVAGCVIRSALSLMVASGLVLALGGVSWATPAPCPPTCPGGPPYAEVTFLGTVDYFELSSPFMIDVTLSNPQGSGEGVASLPAGQLGAQATGTGSGFGVLSQGVDVFTVGGLNPGTVVPVTATLTANGNGLITIPGASGGTMVQIGQFGGSQDFQQKVFQAGNNAPTNTPFPIGLGASTNFNAIDGTPFSLDYFLRLDVNNGTTFDFLHTGRLSFTLPFGATISSDGGFSVAPVPEPTTGVLFASSLAGLGIWRWRKWSGLWRSSRTNED